MISLALLLLGCTETVPITEQDRQAVLRIEDLAVWMEGFRPVQAKSSFTKTKELDDSYDLEYGYEDTQGEFPIYLHFSVSVQPDKADALLVHKATNFGTWIGSGETKMVPRNDLFSWGDDSKFCLWQTELGDTFGNYFTGRKGEKVVTIAISGIYFSDPESIHELLDEKLKAVELLPVP